MLTCTQSYMYVTYVAVILWYVICLPAVELINLILFLSLVTSIRVLTFLLFYLSIKPTAFLFLTFFQLLTLLITLSSQYSSILRLAQRWDREDGGGAGKMGVGQGRWGWGMEDGGGAGKMGVGQGRWGWGMEDGGGAGKMGVGQVFLHTAFWLFFY